MRKLFVLAGIVAGLVVLGAPPGLTQSSDDLNNLRKEVEALKEGQKAIQSDLQEIKNLLRSRPTAGAPAAAPAAEVTLSVDGAPVKGDKAAKVTLVDFTDYQ
jgi:protein-disulfide isomerase